VLRRVLIGGAAAVLGLLALAPTAQGRLTADYRFEDNRRSAVPGASKLLVDGPGVIEFSEQKVRGSRQGVLKWPEGTGLRLNDATKAVGNQRNDYTIVMLVNLDDVASYNKVIAFRGDDEDDGLYVYSGGLYPYGPNADRYTEDVFGAGKWVQIALVRSKQGQIKCFVGDERQVREGDPEKTLVLGTEQSLLFLRDDLIGSPEETGGRIARLRIWDDALSEAQIAGLSL
jgi:hypothetical protein